MMIEKRIEKIETELEKIKKRNESVELEKHRESSIERKALILIFTRSILTLYMWFIGIKQPRIHAVIPSVWFWLSTLSFPSIKRFRKNRQKRK